MNILFTVHQGFWKDFSGTPLIAKQYINLALQKNYGVALVVPEDEDSKRIEMEPAFAKLKVLPWPKIKNWGLDAFQSFLDIDQLPSTIAPLFQPDLIHIVDWVDLHPSILPELRKLKVPILRHFWNFEDLCFFYQPIMFNQDKSHCRFPLESRQCAECITRRLTVGLKNYRGTLQELKKQVDDLYTQNLHAQSVRVKRKWETFDRHLDCYDHLLFPSKQFLEYFQSSVSTKKPFSVINHGLPIAKRSLKKNRANETLSVVSLNGFDERKGWPDIEDAFDGLLRSGKKVKLRVYGVTEEQSKQSKLSEFEEVAFFERFKPQDLESILSWADVGVIPTNFETYCRVVREFILNGVIPISTDAFGVTDIVKHRQNGLILDRPYNVSLRMALEELIDSRDLVGRLRSGVTNTVVISDSEEFENIENLYLKLISEFNKSAQVAGS
jgi:O-antigen biosynthesis protein